MPWKSIHSDKLCFYCNAATVTRYKKFDYEGVTVEVCDKCVNVTEDTLLARKIYGENDLTL